VNHQVRSSRRVTLAWVLLVAMFVYEQGCQFAVNDARGFAWDPDGDTISTAVELESHNRLLYGFDTTRFDLNPSRASGTRSSGSLVGGLNLPDTGFGYRHYLGSDSKDTDDWGTLSLINVIEQVGRQFRRRPCQTFYFDADRLPREQSLDMSLQYGGPFVVNGVRQHDEHQNGLDVDVRYMRDDGEGLLDLSDGLQRSHFDQTATLELLSCFLRTGRVIRILYDSALTNIVNAPGDTTLLDFPDHTDHFHVRIADPD